MTNMPRGANWTKISKLLKSFTPISNAIEEDMANGFEDIPSYKNSLIVRLEKGSENPLYNPWQDAVDATAKAMAKEIEEEINKRVTKDITNMAKLNKKKKASDVLANLTPETKKNSLVYSSSDGKVLIIDKPKPKFSMRHLRG